MEYIVDTNVFIRFFTKDSSVYQEKALKIMEALYDGKVHAFICESVFAEIAYVLESIYQWSHNDIANALMNILSLSGIISQDNELFKDAIDLYDTSHFLDIEDCIQIAFARKQKRIVLSFDKGMDKAGISRVEEI